MVVLDRANMSRFIDQPNHRNRAQIYLQLQLFRATTLVILKSEVPNVKIHQILRQRANQGLVRYYH